MKANPTTDAVTQSATTNPALQSALENFLVQLDDRAEMKDHKNLTSKCHGETQGSVNAASAYLIKMINELATPTQEKDVPLVLWTDAKTQTEDMVRDCLAMIEEAAILCHNTQRDFGGNDLMFSSVQKAAVDARERASTAAWNVLLAIIEVDRATHIADAVEAVLNAQ